MNLQRRADRLRISPERGRLTLALLLSLLIHALLLSLTFGGPGLGLPGLRFPWEERRIEAPELRVVVVPAQVTAAEPAVAPVTEALQQPRVEESVANGSAPPPSMSRAPTPRPTTAAIAPESNPLTDAATSVPPANTPSRAEQSGDTAPPTPAPAVIAVERTDEDTWSIPVTPATPAPIVAAAPSASSTETAMPSLRDTGDAARARIEQEASQRAVEPAKIEPPKQAEQRQAEQLEAARQEAARAENARLEAERQEAARQLAALQEAARQDAVRQETARAEKARLEAERQEAARQEGARVEAAKVEATRVEAAKIAAAEAEAARVEAAKIEAAKIEAARVEAAKIEAARAEAARVEAAQAEAAKVEAARVEAAKVEAARAEAAKIEAAQAEAARVEAAKAEAARVEAAKIEAAQAEAARVEAAKAEAARAEAARAEAAKVEAARVEAAKIEAARAEAARAEAAKVEAARVEAARVEAEQEAAARREAALKEIGRELDEKAARREAAAVAARQLPSSSNARRYWLLGRADPNSELIQYVEAWSRKIELNMTFDIVREAAKQPHTDPLVTVAIRSDGSIESVTFVQSSGVAALDEAIRRVVDSQKPYQEFPPGLARDYDVIMVRRTWHFDSAIRMY